MTGPETMKETTGTDIRRIGIIGGTGKEGLGLAYRWAKAGYTISIGSRQIEKAQQAAARVSDLLGNGSRKINGVTNTEAAASADVAVLTVPYAAHKTILAELVDSLQGKILIDVTVPLVPPQVTRVQLPEAGSAALEAQALLGPKVQVVSAFQNISHERLLTDDNLDCDVLVCGGNRATRGVVIELVHKVGLVGWDAGPIENSVVAEGLTSILIHINKRYGCTTAGIRVVGTDR